MNVTPAFSFWQKNKLVLKSFFIGFLILVLLIPAYFIMNLVNERKERKQEVTREISNKWSAAQTITGPFLMIPYSEPENNVLIKKYLYILPEQLDINGNIEPEIRYRSIYKVPVFTARPLLMKGSFSKNSLNAVNVNPALLKWSEAKLCVGISDLKGMKEQAIKWNEQLLTMESGLPNGDLANQGINSSLSLDSSFLNAENKFSIHIILQGSEKLYFTPLGSTTSVHLYAVWDNPAFDGKYLPDTEKVSKSVFDADWKIL